MPETDPKKAGDSEGCRTMTDLSAITRARARSAKPAQPSKAQRSWLVRGMRQPGGKLPLFDERGQRISRRTIDACLEAGWCTRWFDNPLKPDWQVCRLTEAGRKVAGTGNGARASAP